LDKNEHYMEMVASSGSVNDLSREPDILNIFQRIG